MSSQDLASEIQQGKDELTRLLRFTTLFDIIVTIAVLNLKDGRVRMNYQSLKDFFEELRQDETLPEEIKKEVRRAYGEQIDQAMSAIGIGGLYSWYCEVKIQDYWYMDENQIRKARRHYERSSPEKQAVLEDIAKRYQERSV